MSSYGLGVTTLSFYEESLGAAPYIRFSVDALESDLGVNPDEADNYWDSFVSEVGEMRTLLLGRITEDIPSLLSIIMCTQLIIKTIS